VRNRRFHPALEQLVTWLRGRRVREIERRAGRGRVLDIGCGRGITLAQLAARGWEVHGTELSAAAAAPARELLGDAIRVESVLASSFPPGFFDVIILWHVLEHLPEPRAVVAKCRELLRPGGLLVVAVPNFDSLQRMATGRHWFHLDLPRHLTHFGAQRLRELLAEHGLVVDTVSHFSFEQNPYGWIQSLLNRSGFRSNLLYDLIKLPSARSEPQPWRSHPVQSLLLAPVLLAIVPLSLLLFAVEVVLRRGGTVEVYARAAGPRAQGQAHA
jgi:SAM-dependent methyltransferase